MTASTTQSEQKVAEKSSPMGSTNDLAADAPTSRLDRILQWVPRILASKPHVIALMGLGERGEVVAGDEHELELYWLGHGGCETPMDCVGQLASSYSDRHDSGVPLR